MAIEHYTKQLPKLEKKVKQLKSKYLEAERILEETEDKESFRTEYNTVRADFFSAVDDLKMVRSKLVLEEAGEAEHLRPPHPAKQMMILLGIELAAIISLVAGILIGDRTDLLAAAGAIVLLLNSLILVLFWYRNLKYKHPAIGDTVEEIVIDMRGLFMLTCLIGFAVATIMTIIDGMYIAALIFGVLAWFVLLAMNAKGY
jgi:hypothetical protein